MRRIPGLARSTGKRHAIGALRHSRVQVWSASARRSPRRPARRASADLSTGPLVGYGITASTAVPGCRYARTVVARWLSLGQPTRGLAWTARVGVRNGLNGPRFVRLRMERRDRLRDPIRRVAALEPPLSRSLRSVGSTPAITPGVKRLEARPGTA